jgi:hypothetical protein
MLIFILSKFNAVGEGHRNPLNERQLISLGKSYAEGHRQKKKGCKMVGLDIITNYDIK